MTDSSPRRWSSLFPDRCSTCGGFHVHCIRCGHRHTLWLDRGDAIQVCCIACGYSTRVEWPAPVNPEPPPPSAPPPQPQLEAQRQQLEITLAASPATEVQEPGRDVVTARLRAARSRPATATTAKKADPQNLATLAVPHPMRLGPYSPDEERLTLRGWVKRLKDPGSSVILRRQLKSLLGMGIAPVTFAAVYRRLHGGRDPMKRQNTCLYSEMELTFVLDALSLAFLPQQQADRSSSGW